MKSNSAITPESAALHERVLTAKKKCKVTFDAIAKEAGMYRPTVTNQINGHFNIDVRVLLAVARLCPDISAEWLLRGTGDMTKSELSERISRLEKLLDGKN